jgi:hypothetical protein
LSYLPVARVIRNVCTIAAVLFAVASLQGRSTRGQRQALWPHVVRATKTSAARLALRPAIHRFATRGLRSSVQRIPLFASPRVISHITGWPAAERAKLETKRRASIISKWLSDLRSIARLVKGARPGCANASLRPRGTAGVERSRKYLLLSLFDLLSPSIRPSPSSLTRLRTEVIRLSHSQIGMPCHIEMTQKFLDRAASR